MCGASTRVFEAIAKVGRRKFEGKETSISYTSCKTQVLSLPPLKVTTHAFFEAKYRSFKSAIVLAMSGFCRFVLFVLILCDSLDIGGGGLYVKYLFDF